MWGRKTATKQVPDAFGSEGRSRESVQNSAKKQSGRAIPAWAMIGLIMVSAVLIGYAIMTTWKYVADQKATIRVLPTEEEYLTSHLDSLLQNPPKPTDTDKKKAEYYDDLVTAYAEKKQYKEAVGVFAKRESISGEKIKFYQYMNAAQYYYLAGDKSAALVSLDKAEAAMPAENNEATGFDRQENLGYITQLKKEYAQ